MEDADAAQQAHALLPAKCEAAKPEVDVLVAELLLANSAASVPTRTV